MSDEHPMPDIAVNELPWVRVESSNLHAIAQEGEFLYIKFSNETVYRYRLPAEEGFDLLLEAEENPEASVGKAFHQHVRGRKDIGTAQITTTNEEAV